MFEILLANDGAGNRMWTAFMDGLLLSANAKAAEEKVAILESLSDRSQPHLERLREGAHENSFLSEDPLKGRINAVLRFEGLSPIPAKSPRGLSWDEDDELPF